MGVWGGGGGCMELNISHWEISVGNFSRGGGLKFASKILGEVSTTLVYIVISLPSIFL